MLDIKRRVHEWFAQRISWVQYPQVTLVRLPFFKHRMHWESRALLMLVGVGLIALGIIALASILALAWWAVSR